jgi:hypothetical protein
VPPSLLFLLVQAVLSVQATRTGHLVEEVRWGGADGDTLLASLPAAAALHPSGALVVLLPQSGRVLLRQPGQPFRQIGRQGQGPGEFSRPIAGAWQGDSLWIWDSGQGRLTWLDARGRLLRSEGGRAAGVVHPLSDGTWLRFPARSLDDTAAAIELIGRDRSTSRRILTYSWPRAPALNIPLGGASIVGIQPFAARATISVDPATSDLLLIEPTRISGVSRFRRVTPTGRQLVERRLTLPIQLLTDAHFDAAIESWREGGAGPHRSVPEAVLRKAIHRPRYLPTVRGQVVATDGSLWLQAGPETASRTTWIVLDGRGLTVGQVTGPPRVRLLAVSGAKVIGASTDELGIVSLVQYRLDH